MYDFIKEQKLSTGSSWGVGCGCKSLSHFFLIRAMTSVKSSSPFLFDADWEVCVSVELELKIDESQPSYSIKSSKFVSSS